MVQLKHAAIYIIFALALVAGTAAAQKRPRPKTKPSPPAPRQANEPAAKRPVTVNLIEGEPVQGNFLQADAESMQVEVQSGRLTIKMKNVASLVFATEENQAMAKEEKADPAPEVDLYQPAARKARAELRRLAEAAKIKLPYGQYGSLLIEIKPAVEEIAASLPECPLKNDILRAIEVYTDAGLAWGAADNRNRIPLSSEPGPSLMKKYGIQPELNRLAQPDHLLLDTALSAIWGRASFFYNNISSYLRQ